MTRENIELLMKDLSCRIPYGVIVNVNGISNVKLTSVSWYGEVGVDDGSTYLYPISEIKPYLFPLSNMTKEQYKEWSYLGEEPLDDILTKNANGEKMSTLEHHLLVAKSLTDPVNYCYKNHFDIYGLISMGLANDATGLNIY